MHSRIKGSAGRTVLRTGRSLMGLVTDIA